MVEHKGQRSNTLHFEVQSPNYFGCSEMYSATFNPYSYTERRGAQPPFLLYRWRGNCPLPLLPNVMILQILSADGTQEVGVITRKWLGFAKSFFNVEAQHTFVITCKYYNIIYQHQISYAYI